MKNRIIAFSVALIVLTTCIVIPVSAASKNAIAVLENLDYFYYNPDNWPIASYIGYSEVGNPIKVVSTKPHTYVYAIPKQTRATFLQYDIVFMCSEEFRYGYMTYDGESYTGYTPAILGNLPTITYENQTLSYMYQTYYDSFENSDYIVDTNSSYIKVVDSLEAAAADYLSVQPNVSFPYLVPNQQAGEQIYNTLTENITYRAYSSSGNVYAVLLKNIANLGDRPLFYSMDDTVSLNLRRPSGNYSVTLSTLPNTASNGMHYYLFNPNDANSTCSISYIPIIDCNNQPPDYNAICEYLIQYSRSFMSYALPPGNVIYIEVPQNEVISYTLTTTMPKKSSLSTGSWASSQCIGYKTTLPDAGTEFPGLLEPFKWSKNPNGKYDAFNSTYDAIYQKTNEATVSNYLMIYNPTYFGDSELEVAAKQNNTVYITIDKAISAHAYQLKTGITDGIEGVVDISTSNGTSWTGIPNYQTHEWEWVNDQTGQPEEPTYGGQNIISNSADNFSSWLKNTLTTIGEFFTSGHDAILTLTNAIGNFIGSLKSLYLWLPTPVYSLLTSAIMIAITIGVIKIFV